MIWRQRAYKILSVFFYAYGASIPSLGLFIASTDITHFTLYNLFLWPSIAGFIAVFPQLGKMFSEASNDKKVP